MCVTLIFHVKSYFYLIFYGIREINLIFSVICDWDPPYPPSIMTTFRYFCTLELTLNDKCSVQTQKMEFKNLNKIDKLK